METEKFTKYEKARIIGARALQIAMDAPILVNLSEEKLTELKYDALNIAEYEFKENVLPITIHRPTPRKRKDKLTSVREEGLSDEALVAKAQEVEKEIVEDAKEMGLVNEADDEDSLENNDSSEES